MFERGGSIRSEGGERSANKRIDLYKKNYFILEAKRSRQLRVFMACSRHVLMPLFLMDTLTSEQRSERMGRVRGRDTGTEMRVRRLLYRLGYRYRLHARDLPGCPDIVFRRRKIAVFVHGCFWHRHTDPNCKLARLPKSRLDFWLPKLEGNRLRDLERQRALNELGWRVLIVWECQTRNTSVLETVIREKLGEP
ncbi:MAG: very short patch repair endonuclease [Devosia sp.]|nr:very short patch repair endonuclease [Devosia sp.]